MLSVFHLQIHVSYQIWIVYSHSCKYSESFFIINLRWFLINSWFWINSHPVNTGPSLGHILCFFLFLLFVNFVLLNWTFEYCNVAFGISGYFSKILLFGELGWLKSFLCYLLIFVTMFLTATDCAQACEHHTGTQQLS